ncbi:MAG: patatin-like phospholipase family protein [Acholeplasmataceae bacterium]|jgi:NTE family protein|nr:patatin-like phospholipase family protein [Acholeplasmataceae bacterium]
MKYKVGLALGGGGARGSYQIGVLKALDEAGILSEIEHVSGTSIGAINTLMVMAKLSYDRMIDIWKMIDNTDIYGHKFDKFKFDKMGLFSLKDMYHKLTEQVTLDEIRTSKMQGYVTAAKIKKGSMIDQVLIHRMKKEVFHLNDVDDPHRAVLASASIPVLFGSTEIDNAYFVDGGAIDNCPIKPLIEQGCHIIIAVPIDGRFHEKKYQKEDILLINLEANKLFSFTMIDILNFKPEEVEHRANYGYLMTKNMLQKLHDLGYYQDGLWMKPSSYEHVSITKDEEQKIKEEVAKWH